MTWYEIRSVPPRHLFYLRPPIGVGLTGFANRRNFPEAVRKVGAENSFDVTHAYFSDSL
jgi:hypothetical protein